MSKRGMVWEGSDLIVDFDGGTAAELVDAVIDVDPDGSVLGIEILGLVSRHPGLARAPEASPGHDGGPIVSVDAEADALYVRFYHGRSVDQLVRQAVVAFDSADRLLTLRVRMDR